jgi:hypothetical protein
MELGDGVLDHGGEDPGLAASFEPVVEGGIHRHPFALLPSGFDHRRHHLQDIALPPTPLDPIFSHPLSSKGEKRTFLLGEDRTLLLWHDTSFEKGWRSGVLELNLTPDRPRGELNPQRMRDSAVAPTVDSTSLRFVRRLGA